ncbi:MAG: hypothetical protein RSF40_02180 [Oscillospiraceae bacterium]
MECKFLNDNTFVDESTAHNIEKFTPTFNEHFPFYLSIGMTSAEYWDGDCLLTQSFRKSFDIKRENENENAWLHGLYVYNALSTAIGNAFGNKDGKNTSTYPQKPYSFDEQDNIERKKELQKEQEELQAEAWMHSLVQNYNNI